MRILTTTLVEETN